MLQQNREREKAETELNTILGNYNTSPVRTLVREREREREREYNNGHNSLVLL